MLRGRLNRGPSLRGGLAASGLHPGAVPTESKSAMLRMGLTLTLHP